MANYNKFNLNDYISFGFNTYEEYEKASNNNENMESSLSLIASDVEKYLDLVEEGYSIVLDDIKEMLDINNNNTIQIRIMKYIDKMYINKPCKDFLYLMLDKKYNGRMPNFTNEMGLTREDLLVEYPFILKKCNEVGLTLDLLSKRTLMKSKDIETAIRKSFKKEVEDIDIENNNKVISYVDITDEEIELIMTRGLKSDKTIREEEGFSNLNQLQRRLKEGYKKTKSIRLRGYIGRFVLVNETGKKPIVRYLFNNSYQKIKKR